MTTPLCPRCNAPLNIGSDRVWCDAYGCAYGHDTPRTMVPQPDLVGAAPIPVPHRLSEPMERAYRTDPAVRACLEAHRYDYVAALETLALHLLTDRDHFRDIVIKQAQLAMPRRFILAQPAPTPAADAKSVGVDEGMRERVLAVLRKDMPGEYSRMVRLSDDICAAILASHEIVRRLQ